MKRSLSEPCTVSLVKRIKPIPAIVEVKLRKWWPTGSVQHVQWKSQGDIPEVGLELRQQRETRRAFVHQFEFKTTNKGAYHATVPTGLTPGRYLLRIVSSADNSVCADSSEFTITASASPALTSVSVACESTHTGVRERVGGWACSECTSQHEEALSQCTKCHAKCKTATAIHHLDLQAGPRWLAVWPSGSQQRVTWTSEGEVPKVAIDLCQHRDFRVAWVSQFEFATTNTGGYDLTVPTGLMPGRYLVRILSSADNRVFAHSAEVLITSTDAPPAIADVAVHQAEWRTGSTQRVAWSSQGAIPKVDIELRQQRETRCAWVHQAHRRIQTPETSGSRSSPAPAWEPPTPPPPTPRPASPLRSSSLPPSTAARTTRPCRRG